MIVDEKVRILDKNIGDDISSFKILANRKSFKILSDGLYSDKILAVIRELSTNAWDSHVAANKTDIPFKIHLPNSFETWFSVRDYGVGLSHEDVFELYTTYFSSTKTTSNLFVGSLGLGSKSPFCYSSMFTITSIFNGYERQYSAFIDENEWPKIVLLSEVETVEENGIEIKIPVKSNDCYDFEMKSKRILKFFNNPKPILTGVPDPELNVNAYFLCGNGWGIRSKKSSDRGIIAIQGNIPYSVSIPRELLNNDTRFKGSNISKIMNLEMDIFFDIGSLNYTASRESLEYDSKTINMIVDKMNYIYDDIKNTIIEKFKDCNSRWSLVKKMISFEDDAEKLEHIAYILGVKINDNNVTKNFDLYLNRGSVVYVMENKTGSTSWSGSYKRYTGASLSNNIINISLIKSEIIINDLGNSFISSCYNYMKSNHLKNVYIVTPYNEDDLKCILEQCDNEEFIKSSSIKVKNIKKSVPKSESISAFKVVRKRYNDVEFVRVGIDPNQVSGYYIISENRKPKYENRDVDMNFVWAFLKNSEIIPNFHEMPIYLVRKSYEDRVKQLGLNNLMDSIKENILDKFNHDINLINENHKKNMSISAFKSLFYNHCKIIDYIISGCRLMKESEYDTNHEFIKFMENISNMNEMKFFNAKVLHLLGIDVENTVDNTLIEEYKKYINKYPMIKWVFESNSSYIPYNELKHIFDYIKLVDSCNEISIG